MAVKYPRLCVSHTVRSDSATIRVKSNTPTNDATTAAFTVATYWTDPTYGNALVSTSSPCLLGAVAARIDAATSGVTTVGKNYDTSSSPAWLSKFTAGSGNAIFSPTHAGTTAGGKEILRALGFDLVNDSAQLTSGANLFGVFPIGVWDAPVGESGDTDESWQGYGGVFRTVGGVAYTNSLGGPLARRMVSFRGLPALYTRDRVSTGAASRYSFERCIWLPLSRGEQLRYYADNTAARTYVTSAVLASDSTIALASRTGISASDNVCLDGEWMNVLTSGSGAGNITVQRDNPVAHAANSILSKDFVATYVLDESEGDVSRKGFTPKRRAVNQDRWDFDLALLRAS